MGRFIQYYRENAKYLERTHGFVERVGIEKLRAIVVEDSEGCRYWVFRSGHYDSDDAQWYLHGYFA